MHLSLLTTRVFLKTRSDKKGLTWYCYQNVTTTNNSIYPNYLARITATSADPDQIARREQSDIGLHCLLSI